MEDFEWVGKKALREYVGSYENSIECVRGFWHEADSNLNVFTVVSGQINLDWDCTQANHMWTSSKTANFI
jgi:hypothetical protein